GPTAVGSEQGREDPDRGGLARAVRAEEAEDAAGRHVEGDAPQRLDLPVPLDEVLDEDRGGCHRPPIYERSGPPPEPLAGAGAGAQIAPSSPSTGAPVNSAGPAARARRKAATTASNASRLRTTAGNRAAVPGRIASTKRARPSGFATDPR